MNWYNTSKNTTTFGRKEDHPGQKMAASYFWPVSHPITDGKELLLPRVLDRNAKPNPALSEVTVSPA
jgi:hypothetical protein